MRIYIDFFFFLRYQVQRIVITSSCAAVMSPKSGPTVFSEQDWNLSAIKEVQEKGDETPPGISYRASKTLAEKGVFFFLWEYLAFFLGLPLTLYLENQLHGVFMSSTSLRLNGIWRLLTLHL